MNRSRSHVATGEVEVPVRRPVIFCIVFCLFTGVVLGAFAQSADLPGAWQIKPLLTRGASTPDNTGKFQEFGDTYVTENLVAFWGRWGDGAKDWALFSWKDGKVSRILPDGAEFTAPDGRKIVVNRVPSSAGGTSTIRATLGREQEANGPSSMIRAGRRMLYISTRNPEHVYGWNGETLTRVLGGGETLKLESVQYEVKKAAVLDVDRSGRALLYWDASKPEAEGWVLHDGINFAPLWKEGDALPGRPAEERIKNLSSGPSCVFKCVPPARLLPDGSLLAAVETTKVGPSLVRLSRDKAEILESSPRRILAAEGTNYVADLSRSVSEMQVSGLSMRQYEVLHLNLLLSLGDMSYQREGFPDEQGLILVGSGLDSGYEDAAFLAPDSPRALVAWRLSGVGMKRGWTKAEMTASAWLDLYLLNDHGLTRIDWESALGLDRAAAQQALKSSVSGVYVSRMSGQMGDVLAQRIRLRQLDGPVPGVQVELPNIGNGVRRWFVPATSTDGKLERGPKFNLPGRTVNVADVLAWKGPDTALVGLDDGYFLLERVAGK